MSLRSCAAATPSSTPSSFSRPSNVLGVIWRQLVISALSAVPGSSCPVQVAEFERAEFSFPSPADAEPPRVIPAV